MAKATLEDLDVLQLPPLLKERISRVPHKRNETNPTNSPSLQKNNEGSFILYLPTVVLRKKHNPALALACRLANHHNVPLVILAVVLDDAYLPMASTKGPTTEEPISQSTGQPNLRRQVVMTSRRLAFQLEALQFAANEWEKLGAGVAIRVHGPGSRIPHHLTLARRSIAVVTDEPFVHPYLGFVQAVERTGAITYRVDGSCSVPPASRLKRQFDDKGFISVCKGLPAKAWRWEKMTNDRRKINVHAAVLEGQLDAPNLIIQLDANFFQSKSHENLSLPPDWRNPENPCPGRRPWTVEEMASIQCFKSWSWPGADTSVPASEQTHGSSPAAQKRWSLFLNQHLAGYAKLRNQIQKPHSVSRLSCYLNLGVLSIFQVLHDLEKYRSSNPKSSAAVDKFEEEIVKWREMSYAHTFSSECYNRKISIPPWALRYLDQSIVNNHNTRLAKGLSLSELSGGNTTDTTWNAMQRYLVETGELHNNARMTWGKTLVHWLKDYYSADEILGQMCYLNDRYALDGLSPPSYAGILWCLGWGDKPNAQGGISEKPTWRYRVGPEGFGVAKKLLLEVRHQPSIVSLIGTPGPRRKRQKVSQEESEDDSSDSLTTPKKKGAKMCSQYSIQHHFHKISKNN